MREISDEHFLDIMDWKRKFEEHRKLIPEDVPMKFDKDALYNKPFNIPYPVNPDLL